MPVADASELDGKIRCIAPRSSSSVSARLASTTKGGTAMLRMPRILRIAPRPWRFPAPGPEVIWGVRQRSVVPPFTHPFTTEGLKRW